MPSAALPSLQAASVDWQTFGIAQTGQLDKSNGRTRDSVQIVAKCEARDAAALRRLNARWWEKPFLPPPDS